MLRLEDREWKSFLIDALFEIQIGKNIDGNKVDKNSGNTTYITRKEVNNGVDGFIDSDESYLFPDFPVITIGNETAAPFVQTGPFYTGTKINIMKSKVGASKYSLQFIANSIRKHKNKYSFSYAINSTRLKRQKILLPVTPSGDPDYAFMEAYGKQLMAGKISEYEDYARKALGEVEHKEVPSIQDIEWKPFSIGGSNSIVRISSTASGIDKNKLIVDSEQQNIPYITRSEKNNGVSSFVQMKQRNNYKLNLGDSITIGLDTQTVFFQPHNFYTGQNIQVVDEGGVNKFTSFFLALSIKKQLSLLNWGGNGATLGRLSKKKILLPVTSSGEPDYAFMEQYAKNIYRKKIEEYLDYLGVVKASLQAQPQ